MEMVTGSRGAPTGGAIASLGANPFLQAQQNHATPKTTSPEQPQQQHMTASAMAAQFAMMLQNMNQVNLIGN